MYYMYMCICTLCTSVVCFKSTVYFIVCFSDYSPALSSFIKHYEPLHYDSDSLMWNHHRVRRSMMGDKEISLKFTAYGRYMLYTQ